MRSAPRIETIIKAVAGLMEARIRGRKGETNPIQPTAGVYGRLILRLGSSLISSEIECSLHEAIDEPEEDH